MSLRKVEVYKVLINSTTKKQIDDFISSPKHALALVGDIQPYQQRLATVIAESLLDGPTDKLVNRGQIIYVNVEEDKSEISIDAVRKLIGTLSLKPASDKAINRVVIVKDADKLSHEAQNALLKSLEQPNQGIVFIALVSDKASILPTVYSRLSKIAVRPVGLSQALDYYQKDFPAASIESNWRLSSGLAGMLEELLNGSEDTIHEYVAQAKKFLSLNRYERIIFLKTVTEDREEMRRFLDALTRVVKAAHAASVNSERSAQAKRLLLARKQLARFSEMLAANTSPKLIGLDLACSLGV